MKALPETEELFCFCDVVELGRFARLRFVIDPAVSAVSNLTLGFSNYNVFKANAYSVYFSMTEDSINVNPFAGLCENPLTHYFTMYPNPASTMLIIIASDFENSSIKIYNTRGTLVYSSSIKKRSTPLSFKSFSNEVYYVTVRSGNQCLTKKLRMIH